MSANNTYVRPEILPVDFLSHALEYAEAGIPIFPCVPGEKRPLTDNGFRDATTDEEQIMEWAEKWPDANIGMPTGAVTNTIAIDVDGPDNNFPGDPMKDMDLSRGVCVETPGGGRHYIFKVPDGRKWRGSTGRIADKVDTRCEGGYIVVPPSVVNGKGYKFIIGSLLEGEREEPPAWLLDLLDAKSNAVLSGNLGSKSNLAAAEMNASIPVGRRNDTLTKFAGHLRKVGFSCQEIFETLATLNRSRCSEPLDERELQGIAKSAAKWHPDADAIERLIDEHDENNKNHLTDFEVDIGRLLSTPAPAVEYIFKDRIPKRTLIGLDAQGGIGKTYLTQQFIISAAAGVTLLESFVPTKPTRCLWLQGEDTEAEIHRRFEKILREFDFSDEQRMLLKENLRLFTPQCNPLVEPCKGTQVPTRAYGQLVEVINSFEPEFIVLDPRSSFYAGDENDCTLMAHFMGLLRKLTQIKGSTILTVHHVAKANEQFLSSASGRGSSAARDAQRATFGMVFLSEKECVSLGVNRKDYVWLGQTKANMTSPGDERILLARCSGENGGVLRECSESKLKREQESRTLRNIAERLPSLIGQNEANHSVAEWSKDSGLQEDLQEDFPKATHARIRKALDLAVDQGLLVVFEVEAGKSNRRKKIPRAKA